jgi:hypothetical protein
MVFKVVVVDASTIKNRPKKPKVERGTPRWEEIGIKVRKYMLHPTCPYCGMEDLGKQAPTRPTPNHILKCTERVLDPIPVVRVPILDDNGRETGEFNIQGREGSFQGEGLARTVRIPYRLIRKVDEPVLDMNGEPTGIVEPKWYCSYRWKQVEANDWIWNGYKWVEWYAYHVSDKDYPKATLPVPSEVEGSEEPVLDPSWFDLAKIKPPQ